MQNGPNLGVRFAVKLLWDFLFCAGFIKMIDRKDVWQEPGQVIDIAGWDIHQDYEVFPVGARDKSLRVSPDPAPFDFCLAGHRYLFKEAIKSAKNPNQPRYPDQYWAEVIAFRVGRLMGLTLPPVFVAIDSLSDEPGTVNEWFLGYNDENDERFSQAETTCNAAFLTTIGRKASDTIYPLSLH
ncbi:hypothetical protein [Marinobacter sp. ELB17]|uniref:hypothetical protein n=1 Tax=Marinobacter sp. ELB17 TaxID=270374 RepID=UPI0018DC2D25|nr:hypothetical protein [Marinobacter sp. ELB17]